MNFMVSLDESAGHDGVHIVGDLGESHFKNVLNKMNIKKE